MMSIKSEYHYRLQSLLFSIIILLFVNLVSAGVTGKISGNVTDARTGEPLIGANIILEGMNQGAATDTQGRYFIINISPGLYTVAARVIGYATLRQTQVYVAADLTTNLDFELQTEAIQGQAITVVAERPVIQRDVAGSEMVMREEDVAVFKQDYFQDFMESQVGIFITADEDGSGLSIRGGDIDETNITVNGVSMRNALTQQPNMGISMTSIQEVTITTGGFTAEYGDIRSGMVNVITKEGSRDRYTVSVDARVGPPQYKHYGPNPYAVTGPIWNVYGGDQAYEGVTAEDVANPDLDYVFEFAGWNRVSEQSLLDGDPNNDYTPRQWMEIWRHTHTNIPYATEPEYIFDGTITGPFLFKNSTFLLSQHYENLQLAFPYSRNYSLQSTTQANLTFRPSPEAKLGLTYMHITEQGVATQAQDYSTGMMTGTAQGTRLARDVRWHMLYNPYGINPIDRTTDLGGIKLSHSLNERSFYTLSLTGSRYDSFQGITTHRDTAKSVLVGNIYMEPAPNTGHKQLSNYYDMFDQFWIYGGGRQTDNSKYWDVRLKGILESQLTFRHMLKVGFEAAYTKYDMAAAKTRYDELDQYNPPYFVIGPRPENVYYFDDHPLQVAGFIQNKLEYESMVGNLGLRVEYFNALRPAWLINSPDDSTWYTFYNSAEWERVDEDSNFVNVEYKQSAEDKNAVEVKLSPRLGVSFPVTETSKFYFNYGHFYQLPNPEKLFNIVQGGSPYVPNLHAVWPRTVMYEVGYEKAFAGAFLFRISAYYKDITNQTTTVSFYNFSKSKEYSTTANNSYEDIRGIELRIQKRHGRFGYGWIDFEYISTNEGLTGFDQLHLNWQYEQEQWNDAEQEKNWPVPRVSAVWSFLTPKDFGPQIMGFRPLAFWGLQINAWWRDGGKQLFGSSSTPVWARHYLERIDRHNVDLILRRGFEIGKLDLSLYMRVRNATNFKGPVIPYSSDQYRASLKVPWYDGEAHGNDKYGEGPSDEKPYINAGWQEWRRYLNPRYFMFGLDLNIN
ncbi:TonB-dependent receptor domain-containing protein [Candidatus Neomarinimicrobiota bacterium]